MTNISEYHIDKEIIKRIGLRPLNAPISSQLAANARVYEFPTLENVYVMESDFYGNPMPEGSCFLAVQGKRGLLGRHLKVEKLRHAKTEDIHKMVESIKEG